VTAVDVADEMKWMITSRRISVGWGKSGVREFCPLVALTDPLLIAENALNMYAEWIATEYHRLYIIEEWPEGPHREVVLAAIHSSLHSLLQKHRPDDQLATCEVCLSRKRASGKLEFSENLT
jgi:hypothetical protein